MNKILTKVATLALGAAMAVGVGVAVGSKKVSEAKADNVTDEITANLLVATSTTYKDFSGVSVTSDAVYAGNSAKTSSSGIQLRSKNSESGIVSTTSGGTVVSVSITVESGSNTVDIYGSNTAYTAASDLYKSTTQGKKVGSVSATGTVSFTDSYSYVGIRSNNGALYLTKVSVVWDDSQGGGGGTSYTITYDANGGSGTMSDTTNTVADCTFTAPKGKEFSTWNTASNGGGKDYAPGAIVTDDTDLYAIWVDKPVCVTLDKIGTGVGSAYTSEVSTTDIVDGSDTYTLNYVNGKKQGDAIILQKDSGAYISNKTAMPGNITSIVLYINSGAAQKATYDVAFGVSEFTAVTAGIGAENIVGGSSHEFENSEVSGARYFCISLGNSNNGQVLKIVVNYEEAVDPTLDTLVVLLNDATGSPVTLPYSNGSLWYANDKDGNDINAEWSSSNEAVFTMSKNGNNVGVCTPVGPGTANIIAHAEGYNDGVCVLTITIGDLSSITVTGSMTKTEYLVGEPWNAGGLVATGTYTTGYSCDVTSQVEWSYSPESPVVTAKSVVATATIGSVSGNSSAQSVNVTKTNPLRAIYDMAANTAVDVYGYYVGFAKGTGPVIMDGEYGMIVYSKTHDVEGYVEGQTILHVTGNVSIFNGLYEIEGSSVSITAVESADVSTPVTYTISGTPTKYEQNRLTYVSGVPTTSGNLDGTPGSADITLTFTKGTDTTSVFLKKAAQTSENMAALKAAVVAGDEITVKCFTSWYNAFQVQFVEIVEVVDDYTAEQFSQQLLDLTDAVCEDYDDVTNNKDALVLVWNTLNDNDHYNALPKAQKYILSDANADEKGSTIEQAIARYEYLCGKYGLAQFIEGRDPIPVTGNFSIQYQSSIDSSSSITIIVVVAVASMTLLGVTLVLRKRKHQ